MSLSQVVRALYYRLVLTLAALLLSGCGKGDIDAKEQTSAIQAFPFGAAVLQDGKVGYVVDDVCYSEYWLGGYHYANDFENIASLATDSVGGTVCALDRDGYLHVDGAASGETLLMILNQVDLAKQYRKVAIAYDEITLMDQNGDILSYHADSLPGYNSIPKEWMDSAKKKGTIVDFAKLYDVLFVLYEDGTVDYYSRYSETDLDMNSQNRLVTFNAIGRWSDIVELSAGHPSTVVGLKSDGTIVIGQTNAWQIREAEKWTDIEKISYFDSVLVGLKSDGTVSVTGGLTEENKENISLWQDVTDISVGQIYCVGITSKDEVLMERIDHVY